MINRTKLLYSLFIIIILAGIVYFLSSISAKPYKVTTPTNYPEGTVVSLYKDAPPEFPLSILLEDTPPEHSSVVVSKEGREQMTLVYVSELNIPNLIELYKNSLLDQGWEVSVEVLSSRASTMLAHIEGEELIATFTEIATGGTRITFQYQK